MALHWLSFADPQRPRGKRFLGVAIVEADDFMSAVSYTHLIGCNPGGEIQAVELPADVPQPPDNFKNRLLCRKQIIALEAMMARMN